MEEDRRIDLNDIKDQKLNISVGTWLASIIITISLTTIFWELKTLGTRMDKRYVRQEENMKTMQDDIDALVAAKCE